MSKKLSVGALALALVAALVPSGPVNAQTEPLKIKVGAGLGREVPGFTTRIFAPEVEGIPTITVARETVVRFTGQVILLPTGETPESWREAVASQPDDPFFVLRTDPDADLPGVNAPVGVNTLTFMPTDRACGTETTPCEFDGSGTDPIADVLNTGDESRRTYVRITAQHNATVWAVQPIPYLDEAASLRIQVANPNDMATTQAAIDEARAELRDEDIQLAKDTMAELSQPSSSVEDGVTVHNVHVGGDEGPVALFTFLPHTIDVNEGDKVRFLFDTSVNEPHTATFPFKAGAKVTRTSFVPACDPDGDGDGPDEQPDFSGEGPPCPEEDQIEFDLRKKLTAQIGDGRFPAENKAYESSGMRWTQLPEGIDGLAGGTDPWDVQMTARNTDGFRYLCAFHGGFMSGLIKVR